MWHSRMVTPSRTRTTLYLSQNVVWSQRKWRLFLMMTEIFFSMTGRRLSNRKEVQFVWGFIVIKVLGCFLTKTWRFSWWGSLPGRWLFRDCKMPVSCLEPLYRLRQRWWHLFQWRNAGYFKYKLLHLQNHLFLSFSPRFFSFKYDALLVWNFSCQAHIQIFLILFKIVGVILNAFSSAHGNNFSSVGSFVTSPSDPKFRSFFLAQLNQKYGFDQHYVRPLNSSIGSSPSYLNRSARVLHWTFS